MPIRYFPQNREIQPLTPSPLRGTPPLQGESWSFDWVSRLR